MNQDAKQIDFLKRKIEREKMARAEAEHLLELKSRELYSANQQLIDANKNLDEVVAQRTKELRQAQKVAETAAVNLKKSLDRLKLIIQASGATTWDWNLADNSFHCSGTTANTLSSACAIDAADNYDQFIKMIHWDDRKFVEQAFNDHMACGKSVDLECRFLDTKGQYRWFHMVGQAELDPEKNTSRMVGSFADIHERRESEKIIEKMAHFDSLTNVPNRSYFNKFFNDSIESSRIRKTHFALLIIDLNDFKITNDRYGHQVGDALLVNVASILKSHIKGYDLVARLGGDEFALILNELPPKGLLDNLCNSLISACAKPIELAGHQLSTNLSIGIARYPEDGESVERLLRCADMAMYAAKQSKVSGSTFANYRSDLDAEYTRKRSLRDEIENALAEQRFHLEFQPCVEILLACAAVAKPFYAGQKNRKTSPFRMSLMSPKKAA